MGCQAGEPVEVSGRIEIEALGRIRLSHRHVCAPARCRAEERRTRFGYGTATSPSLSELLEVLPSVLDLDVHIRKSDAGLRDDLQVYPRTDESLEENERPGASGCISADRDTSRYRSLTHELTVAAARASGRRAVYRSIVLRMH